MENPKLLVTFGSDSSIADESNKSWVNYLSERVKFEECLHFALPNIGNDEIARKVLFEISSIIQSKRYESKDILVGIMWEDMSRISEVAHDKIKCTIVNYEHYLRTEMFLKKLQIKYFMTRSHPNAKASERNGMLGEPYVKLLHYGLDYMYWLRTNSLYMFCQDRKMQVNEETKAVITECHSNFVDLIMQQLEFFEFVEKQ